MWGRPVRPRHLQLIFLVNGADLLFCPSLCSFSLRCPFSNFPLPTIPPAFHTTHSYKAFSTAHTPTNLIQPNPTPSLPPVMSVMSVMILHTPRLEFNV